MTHFFLAVLKCPSITYYQSVNPCIKQINIYISYLIIANLLIIIYVYIFHYFLFIKFNITFLSFQKYRKKVTLPYYTFSIVTNLHSNIQKLLHLCLLKHCPSERQDNMLPLLVHCHSNYNILFPLLSLYVQQPRQLQRKKNFQYVP